jgi:hypothetical protein
MRYVFWLRGFGRARPKMDRGMVQEGKTQRDGLQRPSASVAADRLVTPPPAAGPAGPPPPLPGAASDQDAAEGDNPRRAAKRRPAGPPRARIAANDDAPSIGGLIFALQQRPSRRPFQLAAIASGAWIAIGAVLAWAALSQEGASLASPTMVVVVTTIFLPIALFWFLAMLVWRAQELKLMSSAMTEVAVRLAEPDRAAEQAAASLGQAVRRQVSFMNDAISRALGRAGELEALVHNEVAALEKSYGENEHKIKGLIQELVGERHALVSTTDKVAETLKSMGSDVPALIDKLSQQQIKLAKIIEGAGQNLIALENQLATASGGLENALSNRTQQLQAVLDDYTVALDATLASRAEALDVALVERTRALDAAFAERLALFDDAMVRSTVAIDTAVNDRSRALTVAMESHVRALSDTLGRQANSLDESMLHGIDAVRRTSDSITRQSLHAIEGLTGQADLLKNVSENLLQQIATAASRFDQQGQSMVTAASALEKANMRMDATLQKRQGELSDTLQRLSGKTSEIDEVMRGYSATLETSIAHAENRARTLIQQLAEGTSAHAQAAVRELERLRTQTDSHSKAVLSEFERLRSNTESHATRAIADMREKVSGASQELNAQLGSIANRFNETSDDLKARAARVAAELHAEQGRLRSEADHLPAAARENADAMRAALNDQLRALEQLSNLSARERRDIIPPAMPVSLTAAYAAQQNLSPPPPLAAPGMPPETGDRWSLTDLLARASRDEDGTTRAAIINIDSIARALDPSTAAAIWSRFRAGQRGIMVRSIYTAEGRTAFDEVTERYKNEVDFHRTVDRYLTDFEWLLRNVEQKDPSGRTLQNHLVSDSGRVYLFLAHASGRLR